MLKLKFPGNRAPIVGSCTPRKVPKYEHKGTIEICLPYSEFVLTGVTKY